MIWYQNSLCEMKQWRLIYVFCNIAQGLTAIISCIYKKSQYKIKTRYQHLLSHSLTSALSCCRAPMEICLISGSIKSCIKEVEMCLQVDMQAVCATLPCEEERAQEKQKKRWSFHILKLNFPGNLPSCCSFVIQIIRNVVHRFLCVWERLLYRSALKSSKTEIAEHLFWKIMVLLCGSTLLIYVINVNLLITLSLWIMYAL